MTTNRKFAVGDRLWQRNYRGSLTEYRVVGTVGRSYLIALPGQDPSKAERVSYQEAERDCLTDRECDDLTWDRDHRRVLVAMLDQADVETLRRVATVLGYEPGKQAEGREGAGG